MNHVMIDLETLDTRPSATILAIGAVQFDPYTGQTGRCFYMTAKWDQVPARTIDPDTVKWWLTQSEAARKEIVNREQFPLGLILDQFDRWMSGMNQPIVWGNGSSFDITILTHAFDNTPPWSFRNVRDVRTIVELAGRIGIERPAMAEDKAHNALNDAIHQAEYVTTMIQALVGNARDVQCPDQPHDSEPTTDPNEFIDSLGLACGERLKKRLGQQGWEWAEHLYAKTEAMQQIIYELTDDMETIRHSVVGLALEHDIDLHRDVQCPDQPHGPECRQPGDPRSPNHPDFQPSKPLPPNPRHPSGDTGENR